MCQTRSVAVCAFVLLATVASALSYGGGERCDFFYRDKSIKCKLVCNARGYEIGYCDFGFCACLHEKMPPAADNAFLKAATSPLIAALSPYLKPPTQEFVSFEPVAAPKSDVLLPVHDSGVTKSSLSPHLLEAAEFLPRASLPAFAYELEHPEQDSGDSGAADLDAYSNLEDGLALPIHDFPGFTSSLKL